MFDIDLFACPVKFEGPTATGDEVDCSGFSWISIFELRFGGLRRHRVFEAHRLCCVLRDIFNVVDGSCVSGSIIDVVSRQSYPFLSQRGVKSGLE